MIRIQDKLKCCGCGACEQICPRKCISMREDSEGFLYPLVDESLCINCNLCEVVCQYINPFESINEPLHTYAYVNKNEVIRAKSSSGGIFTVLAEYIISQNGVVFGSRYDENWEVEVAEVDRINQLDTLRRSKYVQSKVASSFIRVRKYLNEKRLVLFVGTPCQISGLNHFLRKKYDNLFTVDFTCHAVPSPMVWRDYLQSFRNKGISSINFRDKVSNGWRNYSLEIKDKSGKTLIRQGNKQNIYMRGFLEDLYCRPSCSNCIAREFRTKSDLMIGDFWKIEKYHSDEIYNDNKGVSICMCLTEKGMNLLHSTGLDKDLVEFPYSQAEPNGVHSCIMRSFRPNRMRNLFFKLYHPSFLKLLIWGCIYPNKYIRKFLSKFLR